jgi:hypothetical protein
MRYTSFFVGGVIALTGLFFAFNGGNNSIEINNFGASSSTPEKAEEKKINSDIESQKPLANPPSEIKAVYFTGWSGGNEKKLDYLIELSKTTEINAVVLDVKDYSGYVTYDINIPETEMSGAKEVKIPKINSAIKKLHDNNIYAIARISVFQDPVLAAARPELAVMSSSTGKTWLDNKKLAWIDPASKDAWDYNIAIAKDAQSRGFDELNFDYIRFPSDGKLSDMKFPFWDEVTLKRYAMRDFFKYLRENLPDAKISADLFGMATVMGDFGVGQVLEDAFPYFDAIAPMVYPSHYANGFIGYQNPAAYPYEVVKYSMDEALKRLEKYKANAIAASSTPNEVKFRPWLQDFDLGADYTANMVKAQIKATYDAASSTPNSIDGFMLWNPSNIYTKAAIK